MSVERVVTTPAKGAVIRLKDSSASRRLRLARAALTSEVLAARSPAFSSASCLETASWATRPDQRLAVVAERL
jgi:hypothetical protein